MMFGKWVPGDDDTAVQVALPQTPECGGTNHLLPNERQRATFDVTKVTNFLDGDERQTARRRWIWSEGNVAI